MPFSFSSGASSQAPGTVFLIINLWISQDKILKRNIHWFTVLFSVRTLQISGVCLSRCYLWNVSLWRLFSNNHIIKKKNIYSRRVYFFIGVNMICPNEHPPPHSPFVLHSHPFLTNLSRFDLIANGGASLTLRFERAPFLSQERTVWLPWSQFYAMDTLVLKTEENTIPGCDLSGFVRPDPLVIASPLSSFFSSKPGEKPIIPETQVQYHWPLAAG